MMRPTMELRHLRYFVAVAEDLNFTKAAARLRVAQPALSRQMQSLEDEIGVDLLKRSPRGVTLTAEGKLFFDEARQVIARMDESVNKVRALARGEYGELHVGYAPSASVEILPPALADFKKGAPHVKIVLHELTSNEMAEGLRRGTLDLSIMVRPTEENAVGLEFELIESYPFCVALPPLHPLAKLKRVPIARLVHEPLVSLRRGEYSDFHRLLLLMFAGLEPQPCIVAECDSGSSLFAEVEAGHGLALLPTVYHHVLCNRLELRPLIPGDLPAMDIVVGRATKGDLTPAAEKFLRELLRSRARKGSG
jgi:DNA-binding transcriptional LysR family regulator